MLITPLKAGQRYYHYQIDCDMKSVEIINAFVAPENTRSARFLNGVGFKKTGTLRQVCGDWDIYSMTADEWQNNRIRRHFINTQKQTQNQ